MAMGMIHFVVHCLHLMSPPNHKMAISSKVPLIFYKADNCSNISKSICHFHLVVSFCRKQLLNKLSKYSIDSRTNIFQPHRPEITKFHTLSILYRSVHLTLDFSTPALVGGFNWTWSKIFGKCSKCPQSYFILSYFNRPPKKLAKDRTLFEEISSRTLRGQKYFFTTMRQIFCVGQERERERERDGRN